MHECNHDSAVEGCRGAGRDSPLASWGAKKLKGLENNISKPFFDFQPYCELLITSIVKCFT